MKKILLCLSILSISIFSGTALLYALGDGSSCSTDMPAASGLADFQKETGNSLIATVGYEKVIEKPLDDYNEAVSAKIEGDWYLLGLGYRIGDRFEPYLRVGASEMDISWTERNSLIEIKGETDLALGAGLKILAYKAKLTNFAQLKLNLDGQIRYTEPEFDTVTIAGVSRSVSAREFKIIEGRGAATIGFEISLKKILGDDIYEEEEIDFYLTPYAGVLYSDSKVSAEFEYSGSLYDLSETEDKEKLHLITGVDISAPKYVVLNVEAQIFDGESVSGGATVKF